VSFHIDRSVGARSLLSTRPINAESLSPSARIRIGYNRSGTDITRFVVQLEYRLEDEWTAIVRLDHDAEGAEDMVHDVTEEGLHLDVYCDGEKIDTVRVIGPLPAAEGFTADEEHLATHAERYLNRFGEWHSTTRSDQ